MLLEVANTIEKANPKAWLVVLCGVCIVFLGMLMLTAILYIMSAINKSKSRKAEKKKAEEAKEAVCPEVAPEAVTEDSEEDEIAAVIAAAISAYYAEKGKTSTIKASTVRRICRRVNSERKNG